jgi:hypothetical protein
VREVHVWVGRAWGLQSPEEAKKNGDIVDVQNRPAGAVADPADLDWDLWLGPAPRGRSTTVYFPGPKWYRWWDFGNGTMSDLGSHWIDLPFWALNLKAPAHRSRPSARPPHPEIAPASMQVKYEYGRAAATWPEAHLVPGIEQARDLGAGRHPAAGMSGVLFVGDRGHAALRLRQASCCCRSQEFADLNDGPQPFIPHRSGITPSGFTPARRAPRRPATSNTPAG